MREVRSGSEVGKLRESLVIVLEREQFADGEGHDAEDRCWRRGWNAAMERVLALLRATGQVEQTDAPAIGRTPAIDLSEMEGERG